MLNAILRVRTALFTSEEEDRPHLEENQLHQELYVPYVQQLIRIIVFDSEFRPWYCCIYVDRPTHPDLW